MDVVTSVSEQVNKLTDWCFGNNRGRFLTLVVLTILVLCVFILCVKSSEHMVHQRIYSAGSGPANKTEFTSSDQIDHAESRIKGSWAVINGANNAYAAQAAAQLAAAQAASQVAASK